MLLFWQGKKMAANFELRKDNSSQWYWVFFASNGRAIARSSESYINRGDCLHSIRLIKEDSLEASVFDMTKNPIEIVTHLP
jgi:uncharacterized protein YegP (UPF0339 family)